MWLTFSEINCNLWLVSFLGIFKIILVKIVCLEVVMNLPVLLLNKCVHFFCQSQDPIPVRIDQHGANLLHHQTKGNFKIYSGYLVYLPRQVTVCAVCRHTHTRSRDTQARLVAVGWLSCVVVVCFCEKRRMVMTSISHQRQWWWLR